MDDADLSDRCVYHTHAVDRCSLYGQKGHVITTRYTYVGSTCPDHSSLVLRTTAQEIALSDSGYGSGKKT